MSATPQPMITDERLELATGRSRRRWYTELDDAGAQSWDRKRVERWLGGKRESDAWWARALAADYVCSRSDAEPPETFTVRTSKTLRCSVAEVWPLIDDDDVRRSWLDCELDPHARIPEVSLRLSAADGSRVTVAVSRREPTSEGEERTRVAIEHSRLPRHNEVEETRAFWKACLVELASCLDNVCQAGTD